MLRLENVRKSFRQPNGETLEILDIPLFEIQEGEQMVLLGRSGCGKTTLLHVIAGIRTVDGGKVVLDGLDLGGLSEAGRDRFRAANLGYVFQTFNLLPGFSALENVLLGMTFARRKRDPARAQDLLNRVGLGHRIKHKPQSLSVGEQQRVAVARALANRPRFLLADEPTANLDTASSAALLDVMLGLNQELGVTFVFATHDLQVVERSRRLIRMVDGAIDSDESRT